MNYLFPHNTIGRPGGYANTAGQRHLFPIRPRFDSLTQSLRYICGTLNRCAGQEDCKFVSTIAKADIYCSDSIVNLLTHLLHHFITGKMPIGIVVFFEEIKVQKD